jgi:hypothetical protein
MRTFFRLVFPGAMIFGLGLAHADVVAVVSAKSSVTELTKDQVSDIFLGKTSTFPKGGQAVPIDQAGDAPIRDEFYTKMTGRTAAQLKSYWAKQTFSGKGTPPKVVSGDAEIKKLIAENPNIIGYMDKSKIDATIRAVCAP